MLDSLQVATGPLADLGYVEEASYGKVPPSPALREAVRPLFDLAQDWTGNGTSLREELESVHRQTGRMPERLAVAPVPMPFQRAMRLWQDLHSGRSVGGLGITPLSWVDMHAFCQITGERLSANDLEAVRIIDAEFFESRSAAEKWRGRETG